MGGERRLPVEVPWAMGTNKTLLAESTFPVLEDLMVRQPKFSGVRLAAAWNGTHKLATLLLDETAFTPILGPHPWLLQW